MVDLLSNLDVKLFPIPAKDMVTIESSDAPYEFGVIVFTQAIGGLMYEASIGGQHFANSPIVN